MESDGSYGGHCHCAVVVIFLIFQKSLMKGLTEGAIKG